MSAISQVLDWDTVIAESQGKPLQPDEMTYFLFALKAGCSYSQACRVLKQLVKDGRATRRMTVHNGKSTIAFRLAK